MPQIKSQMKRVKTNQKAHDSNVSKKHRSKKYVLLWKRKIKKPQSKLFLNALQNWIQLLPKDFATKTTRFVKNHVWQN